ncbi:hypothetical protein [Glaesserella sp.]|uniref:hypothetical protein n=1 Tax=Glaesserella sp. TaxID=2094731 RepID=UPI0035A1572C
MKFFNRTFIMGETMLKLAEIPNIWWWFGLICYELLALRLIMRIWRCEELLWFKICYSLIAIIPLIGVPAVYWLVNIPSPQAMKHRDLQRWEADVFHRWCGELEKKKVRTPSDFYNKIIKRKKR